MLNSGKLCVKPTDQLHYQDSVCWEFSWNAQLWQIVSETYRPVTPSGQCLLEVSMEC